MSLRPERRIGAFKPAKSAGLSVETAEALAATALAALTGDPPRLQRFMADSGIGPDDLRAALGSRDILIAALEHVLADESLLLVVATEANTKPETLMAALHLLQTPAQGSM
jgi:hypothetical protein